MNGVVARTTRSVVIELACSWLHKVSAAASSAEAACSETKKEVIMMVMDGWGGCRRWEEEEEEIGGKKKGKRELLPRFLCVTYLDPTQLPTCWATAPWGAERRVVVAQS